METSANPTLSAPLDFSRAVEPASVGMSRQGVQRIDQLFENMHSQGLHPGAQLVVLRNGQVVLDRAIGTAHLSQHREVTPDTPFLVFSVTKPFTAICVHSLVEQGKIELDAPISRYWPEFGCKGKENATVRHALLHQAGIPARGLVRQVWFWPDWGRITQNVAALPAEFRPGEKSAYHLVNFGFILGELVRRVSGQPVEVYLSQTFLNPMRLRNTSLGLADSEAGRSAGIYAGHLGQLGPSLLFNLPRFRRAIIPAATLHSTARDLAVFFQMLINGGQYASQRYLMPETIAHATALGYEGVDATSGIPTRWAMGFHLGGLKNGSSGSAQSMGRRSTEHTFGHDGQGSCIAWADPVAGLVLAFTCNRLLSSVDSKLRWQALADAVWEALLV